MHTIKKNIRRVFALTVLLLTLFSCGASSQASSGSHDVGGGGETSQRSESESDERMVTYVMSIRLSVKNIDDTRTALHEQVKTHNGFIVRETDNQITTRIPTEHMETFITSARALGRVDHESKTGTDITDAYRDNVIRLANMERVRDRFLALLESAESVSDILSVEKELERISAEIEVLKGRIQHAELSVAYSNITVSFREKTKPGPVGWVFYGLYHAVVWLFVW